MRIAIVGFGLIGGSIARALRRIKDMDVSPDATGMSIVAWSPSGRGPRSGLDDGTLDSAPDHLGATIDGADLVVLAAPPLACLALLDEFAGPLRSALAPDTTITDVASTKRLIVLRAAALGLSFVGGHPMAGLETGGYGAARDDLFADRPWLICPAATSVPTDVTRVEDLARACRSWPRTIDPDEHDAAVALISHLPLVLSTVLAEIGLDEGSWRVASSLAAGGWRDMTRLARGDPEMGAGIAATNATELARLVHAAQGRLAAWATDLERDTPDAVTLRQRMERVRRGLEEQ